MKENSSKHSKENDCCHKCEKPRHFIKNYPLHKQDYKDYVKFNFDKGRKRNLVPGHFKRKEVADNVVKQALAAWGVGQEFVIKSSLVFSEILQR